MPSRSPLARKFRPALLPWSTLALACLAMGWTRSLAQSPRDLVVDLRATPGTAVPFLTLNWTQRLQSNISVQNIHRRLKGETTWTLLANLTTAQTTYADTTALSGVEYEYWLERRFTGISRTLAMGYLSAGVNLPAVEARGTLLLVVDSTMAGPLAPEIAQLVQDLTGDGWTVQTLIALRSDPASTVKAQIKAAYDAAPAEVKAVYLLGHVPVPYSGQLGPDGHGDHFGAWPADGYYGDMDGTWTDTSVNTTSASRAQNDNIPGDGKFDQSTLPSPLELQVGRVDLAGMTKAPASAASETTLLRRYLRRAHEFRHRLGAYANIPRRSMIRDGFGFFSGESFASTGWATAFSCVGPQVDTPGADLWYTQADNNTYLWAYGNGGGSYESASSVGTSMDFGRRPSKAVFTAIFGSYHGDWDAGNNFMRAVLAGNAQGDSLGLCCMWAGRPGWFLHPLGMGETLGYAARLSQNNSGNIAGYSFTGSSPRGVHMGLMGDPALRFHMVAPPRGVAAQSANAAVHLAWLPSVDNVLGYHVYRSTSASGPFTRLTGTPIAGTTFTDSAAGADTTYHYMVRAQRLETVPGGSYQNLSHGSFVTITARATASAPPFNAVELTARPVTSRSTILTWSDLSTDETGFRIERRTNPGGSYNSVGTAGADATTFTDSSQLTNGNVYYYRVIALNAAGDARPSEEVAVDGAAGFFDLDQARVKANRATGQASVQLKRLGGSTGSVIVTTTSTADSAVAETHFSPVNGVQIFADGQGGSKMVNFPLALGPLPQLPRQFRFAISSPTGGGALTTQPLTRVLIVDPQATLPAPWQQAILGTVTDSAMACFAENAFGSALIGGSMATDDDGRFIYQSRMGDGVITAFIDSPLIAQTTSQIGVMVRGTTGAAVPMAATMVAGSVTGTNLVTRATDGAGVITAPGTNNALQTPRWVRLKREGNVFTGETSGDGLNWTLLDAKTINVPSTALWGLFHVADTSGNFQTARFRHVSITGLGELGAPQRVVASAAPPSEIGVTWDPVGGAGGYRLERRPQHGTFAPLQTLGPGVTTYTDPTVLAGAAYEYRVQAFQGAIDSGWSPAVLVAAPGTPTSYQQWLRVIGLPADGSGPGAPTATQTPDGISNAMKFALGVNPFEEGNDGKFQAYTAVRPDGGIDLLLHYTRPEPPPAGVNYIVETSEDLSTWSSANVTEVLNSTYDQVRSIVMRESLPSGTAQRVIRLRVVVP